MPNTVCHISPWTMKHLTEVKDTKLPTFCGIKSKHISQTLTQDETQHFNLVNCDACILLYWANKGEDDKE